MLKKLTSQRNLRSKNDLIERRVFGCLGVCGSLCEEGPNPCAGQGWWQMAEWQANVSSLFHYDPEAQILIRNSNSTDQNPMKALEEEADLQAEGTAGVSEAFEAIL